MLLEGKHALRVSAVGYGTYEEEFDAERWPKVVRLNTASFEVNSNRGRTRS